MCVQKIKVPWVFPAVARETMQELRKTVHSRDPGCPGKAARIEGTCRSQAIPHSGGNRALRRVPRAGAVLYRALRRGGIGLFAKRPGEKPENPCAGAIGYVCTVFRRASRTAGRINSVFLPFTAPGRNRRAAGVGIFTKFSIFIQLLRTRWKSRSAQPAIQENQAHHTLIL